MGTKADILWKAANELLNHLKDEEDEDPHSWLIITFGRCCGALSAACYRITGRSSYWPEIMKPWLNENLGSYLDRNSTFDDFNENISANHAKSSQGARYLYLYMAYLMACDEEGCKP